MQLGRPRSMPDDHETQAVFACPKCRARKRLYVELDSRTCKCGALMRLDRTPRVKRVARRYNPDTVPMYPVWRCQACGGLHRHVLALVPVCPVTGR